MTLCVVPNVPVDPPLPTDTVSCVPVVEVMDRRRRRPVKPVVGHCTVVKSTVIAVT